MQNVIANILNQLNEVFKDMDQRVLEESKKWALERRDAMYDFLKSDEAKAMSSNEKYLKAFEVAGGKTWYNKFYGNDDATILAFIEKNCKAIAEKRNHSISKKLEKAGVTEVVSKELDMTTDGFNGVFVINTNNGVKRVFIETVYAGGYNIQCLHLRVLVKVK